MRTVSDEEEGRRMKYESPRPSGGGGRGGPRRGRLDDCAWRERGRRGDWDREQGHRGQRISGEGKCEDYGYHKAKRWSTHRSDFEMHGSRRERSRSPRRERDSDQTYRQFSNDSQERGRFRSRSQTYDRREGNEQRRENHHKRYMGSRSESRAGGNRNRRVAADVKASNEPLGPTPSFQSTDNLNEPASPPPCRPGKESHKRSEQRESFEYKPKEISKLEIELDSTRLAARQRQIDLGKNTLGYQRYLAQVPRESRLRRNPRHPQTPDIYNKVSKRCFSGLMSVWRRQLHQWDPVVDENTTVVVPSALNCNKSNSVEPDGPPPCEMNESKDVTTSTDSELEEAKTEKSIFDTLENDDLLG